MARYIYGFTFAILLSANLIAFAAPSLNLFRDIAPETTNRYNIGTTSPSLIWNRLFVNYASTTALSATNIDASGIITGVFSGSLQGGTAGMLTSWLTDSTLTATSAPTAAFFTATSSSATSQFAGKVNVAGAISASSTLQITGNSLFYGNIGTNVNKVPSGYFNNLYASSSVIDTLSIDQFELGDLYVHGDIFADGGDLNLGTGIATTTLTSKTGLLGIGSTSPWGLLSVNPNALGARVPSFVIGSSTATSFIVDNGGRVGIGSGSSANFSAQTLNIVGGTNNQVNIVNSTSTGFGLVIGYDTTTTGWGTGSGQYHTANGAALINVQNGPLTLGTNNIGRIFIDSSGNVGIGTTTPGQLLAVQGSGYFGSNLFVGGAITATSTLQVSGSVGVASSSPWGLLSVNPNALGAGVPSFVIGSSTATSFIVDNGGRVGIGSGSSVNFSAQTLNIVGGISNQVNIVNSTSTGFGLVLDYDTTTTGWGTGSGQYHTANGTALINVQNGPLTLGTNNAGRVFIDSSGNIGIGTTSPWGLLSINPNALGANVPSFVIGSSTATSFIVDNGGRVGIGTTNPLTPLDVQSMGNTELRVDEGTGVAVSSLLLSQLSQNPATEGLRLLYDSATGQSYIRNLFSAGNLYFDTGGNGLNLNNANTRMTIAGSGRITFSASIVNRAAVTGTNLYVCMGQTAFEMATSTNGCDVSSLRYKENIEPLTYGVADVMKLKPVSFTFKPETNRGTAPQIGFIAEDMAGVIPEVVGYDSLGRPDYVDYNKLTALLTKAVQDQQKEIDALKGAKLENGILTAKKTKVDTLCAGETCVTEDQLKELLKAKKSYWDMIWNH